uniref:Seminal fluid protein 33A1 n=2 Tax=Drosophila melanogaster TaxID=7227 RepID=E1JHF8_DROME|eukprot:NP_001162955.1 seminal fluid protein 33A1 [Drosophila melanogaster]
MKFFILISFLLVCQGSNEEEDNIIAELCFNPNSGPPCQKLKTYYWDKEKNRCVLSRYLMQPCGFFDTIDMCDKICTKESWTISHLEVYVRNMP